MELMVLGKGIGLRGRALHSLAGGWHQKTTPGWTRF